MNNSNIQEECRYDILVRLKKIEGQIRGVAKMIGEDRDCKDIIVQLAAVKAAVSQVGVRVLSGYLASCLGEDVTRDEGLQHNLDEFAELLKKWY